VPVVVLAGLVSTIVVEAVAGASRSERAEPSDSPEGPDGPEPTAERCPDPSDGEASAVAEALETLNVEYPPAPDRGEVEAQYRSLVIEKHPDQGGDAGELIEVREAWETVREREELSGDTSDVGGN
jgi:hypothetical protein